MTSPCPNCGLEFSASTTTNSACPNCGALISDTRIAAWRPIRGYFSTVWKVLTRPSEFFRALPLKGGVSGPLAFALITHWAGSAAGFLWRLSIGGAIGGYFDHLVNMAGDVAEVDNPGRHAQLLEVTDKLKHWFWGAGSIVADPFLTLLQILFISFLVFIGARILVTPGKNGAPREITYESALRIVCYGMTPAILAVLPLFGGLIAYCYQAFVTIIGAREVYRIDGGRAMLVALFPQVLLFGMILLVMFAMAIAFIKFFAMTF